MEPRLIMVIAFTLALSACSSVGTFCDVSDPIRPSSADYLTTETARQILIHNETGARICAWK